MRVGNCLQSESQHFQPNVDKINIHACTVVRRKNLELLTKFLWVTFITLHKYTTVLGNISNDQLLLVHVSTLLRMLTKKTNRCQMLRNKCCQVLQHIQRLFRWDSDVLRPKPGANDANYSRHSINMFYHWHSQLLTHHHVVCKLIKYHLEGIHSLCA